ncbi:MAG: YqeG family HAD IIIA-type phosphatase [Thermoguttaceae bacterium]
MFRIITPHLRIESVLELDLPRLRDMGLDSLMLDVDCTLKSYGATDLRPEILEWLDRLRGAGIGLCLLSNGRGGRIGALAERLKLPWVSVALKPLPFRCLAGLRRLGFDRKRTAVVGDQVFADVMAGRLAGLTTILVRPIQPEEEPWFARMKRPLERVLMKGWDAPSRDRRSSNCRGRGQSHFGSDHASHDA